MTNNELYHHGVKGQKWGIRRYQNENGTLTAEGRRRYLEDTSAAGERKKLYTKKAVKSGIKTGIRTAGALGATKLATSEAAAISFSSSVAKLLAGNAGMITKGEIAFKALMTTSAIAPYAAAGLAGLAVVGTGAAFVRSMKARNASMEERYRKKQLNIYDEVEERNKK